MNEHDKTAWEKEINEAESALSGAIDDIEGVRADFETLKDDIEDLFEEGEGGAKEMPSPVQLERTRQHLEDLRDRGVRIALSLTGECGALARISEPSLINDAELQDKAKRLIDRYQVHFVEARYRVLMEALDSTNDIVRDLLERV